MADYSFFKKGFADKFKDPNNGWNATDKDKRLFEMVDSFYSNKFKNRDDAPLNAKGFEFLQKVETPAAPAAPAPAPAAVPKEQRVVSDSSAPTAPQLGSAPGNPQLTIPGTDVYLAGENIGIKPKKSSSKLNNTANKGTSRLTIPRSSGSSPLNMN